jgi:hypothetical protein
MKQNEEFKWEQPQLQQHGVERSYGFKVVSHIIKETIEASTLTWLQKLVCKWFKITPEKKYWYVIKVKTDTPKAVRINDGVIGLDGNKWRVCDIDKEQYVELRNFEPIVVNGIHGEMMVFCSMYAEGQ